MANNVQPFVKSTRDNLYDQALSKHDKVPYRFQVLAWDMVLQLFINIHDIFPFLDQSFLIFYSPYRTGSYCFVDFIFIVITLYSFINSGNITYLKNFWHKRFAQPTTYTSRFNKSFFISSLSSIPTCFLSFKKIFTIILKNI